MKGKQTITHYIGIDEVGRGPLAGPVTIGVVCVPTEYLQSFKKFCKKYGVTDSKKLSEKQRECIMTILNKEKRGGIISFHTVSLSSRQVDAKGIAWCITTAISRGLSRMKCDPKTSHIALDGLLKAPSKYIHQETIIKGDEKNKLIAVASIVAKVTRDRYMSRVADHYQKYGFEIHKGYGTKVHREMIKRYGLSEIHRKSYCKNILHEG